MGLTVKTMNNQRVKPWVPDIQDTSRTHRGATLASNHLGLPARTRPDSPHNLGKRSGKLWILRLGNRINS